ALLAGQHVVAGAAPQEVVAGAAVAPVRAGRAPDDVVAAFAVEVVGGIPGVRVPRACVEGVVALSAEEGVVARAPVEPVVVVAADEGVVAAFAIRFGQQPGVVGEGVVAGVAVV